MMEYKNSTRRRGRKTAISLGIMGLVLAVSFYAVHWAMNEPPVASQALAQVRPGMSKNEVKAILGPPTRISTTDRGEQWTYSHRLKWQYVTLRFRDDEVAQVELDR